MLSASFRQRKCSRRRKGIKISYLSFQSMALWAMMAAIISEGLASLAANIHLNSNPDNLQSSTPPADKPTSYPYPPEQDQLPAQFT